MGNFLVIVSANTVPGEAERLFRSGLMAAQRLKSQAPSSTVETPWVHAASFARYNGSGTPIVTDPETGSWLLSIGTWFHAENYGSGTETQLLQRYLNIGSVQLGRELEGFFVIVIGDGRTRETIVLTDVVGSCHCFSRSWQNVVALSSSSLLLAGLGDIRLDPVGCQEFLCTGIIYEDRTLYQEVQKLGPASIFQFANGAIKAKQRYWQITDLIPESLDGQAAVRALGDTLTCAARKVGRLFTRPVCDLTGGYDSRALVAAFLMAGQQFATTVSGSAASPDVIISRDLAQMVGLPHLHLGPNGLVSFDQVKSALPFTDGEYDLVDYARVLAIHRTLSERFDVSINGSFGEVARGYWWELLFPRVGARVPLNVHKLAKLRYAAQGSEVSFFPPDTRLDLVAHFTAIIERTNAGLSMLPNTLQMDHAYLMMRMQRWQGRIASSTNQLWPCFSPFLCRSVLETMLQTTTRLRRRGLLIRLMLMELQPRWAAVSLEHGYPALPVTWQTWPRFWPVPVYYGKKALLKTFPRLSLSWGPRGEQTDDPPVRLQLWGEEEVRELLRPTTMKLSGLIDLAAVDNFLTHSQQRHFAYDGLWTRLLSLEYTLHRLGEVASQALELHDVQ